MRGRTGGSGYPLPPSMVTEVAKERELLLRFALATVDEEQQKLCL